jgi:hypothetical protein
MSIFSSARCSQIAAIILTIGIALFVLSLLLPSVSYEQNFILDRACMAPHCSRGWEFLPFGALGALEGQFAWYANPLMLVAVFSRKALGVICALLSVALTIQTAVTLTADWSDGEVPDDVCGFGPGYYLWVACSVLVLVATLLKPPTRSIASDAGLSGA